MQHGFGRSLLLLCLVSLQGISVEKELSDGAEFSRWLRKRGIDDGKVRLMEDDGHGMGKWLVAREDIKEANLLFKIPLQWVMHSEAAKKHPILEPFLKEANLPPGMVGETIRVSLMLLTESCQKGEAIPGCTLSHQKSEWDPYIRVLPKNFSAPLFWSEEELQELQGSQILDMHYEDKVSTEREFRALEQQVLLKDRQLFCSACFDYERYKWASWNVASRALTLQGIKYLIPLADFVNYEPGDHDAGRRNHQDLFLKYHKIEKERGVAEIYADRNFPKGRMIVESYGDNANYMYLRFFGFVPEANPTDCRQLRFDLSQAKEAKDRKQEVLQELRLRPTAETCLRKGQELPRNIIVFLRILHLKGDEFKYVDALRKGFQVSTRNEKAVLKTVISTCDKQLERFRTSVEEDEGKLHSTYDGPPLTVNQRHAIMARVSEMKILKRLKKVTKQKLKALKSDEF